jgi:hypothetical protein
MFSSILKLDDGFLSHRGISYASIVFGRWVELHEKKDENYPKKDEYDL